MYSVRNMPKFDNSKNGSAPKPPQSKEKGGKFPARGPAIETIEMAKAKLRKKEISPKAAVCLMPTRPLVDNTSKKLTELHREFEESIEPLKEEFDARMGRILSEIPPELYAEILPQILFDSWENYDFHMEKTKHTPALRLLLKQALELGKINPDYSNKSIFGHNILEMAGGTGTVIKLLCDGMESVDPERVGKLHFTLNDTSEHMKQIAREKLKDLPCGVRYTGQDIRKLRIRAKSKDTAIMSQVLHLITNPQALEEERQPGSLASNYNMHTVTKIDVIRRAFGTLRQNGYFVLIDEWPATLSLTPENSYERKIYYLFRSIFRPIGDPMALRNRVMKNVAQAKFVAELKIPIDRDHSMYLHLYRKEYSNKGKEKVPDGEVEEAQEKLVKAFTAIDVQFLERYRLNSLSNDNGPLVKFMPLDDEEVFDSRKDGKKAPGKADKKRYNGAIVADDLYEDLKLMPDEKRIAMMQSVIDSVNTGGWLMVMGEWAESGMTKQYFRDTLMRNYNVIFEAALRARLQYGSNRSIYGYLYRKRG
jgi:hypothetical protein